MPISPDWLLAELHTLRDTRVELLTAPDTMSGAVGIRDLLAGDRIPVYIHVRRIGPWCQINFNGMLGWYNPPSFVIVKVLDPLTVTVELNHDDLRYLKGLLASLEDVRAGNLLAKINRQVAE